MASIMVDFGSRLRNPRIELKNLEIKIRDFRATESFFLSEVKQQRNRSGLI